MEITFNKENSASLSQLMATVSAINSQKLPAKQPTGKEQMQSVATDFSERLSAALDDSARRVETTGKVVEKKGPEKNLSQTSEEQTTSLPFGVVPVSTEANTTPATVGTDLLVDLKNAALQGIASGVATILPLIAQVAVPAVINSPVLSALAGGAANAVADLFAADQSNTQKAQNLLQMDVPTTTDGRAVGIVDMLDKHVGTIPELSLTSPVMPTQPNPELSKAPTPANPVVSREAAPVFDIAAKNVLNSVNVNVTTPSGAADSSQPTAVQSIAQPINEQVLTGSLPGTNPATPIPQQIQQDMRSAQISTVPARSVDSLASLNQSDKPVVVTPTETVEDEISTSVLDASRPAVETVVKTSTEQELSKRSMTDSETELTASLSEKSDASITLPVGFDKVVASVNEPAVVLPPVAQPRPDLHEVVKQVMDGMISPTQQLKSSQVIITLKPEHLGEVTVKINVDGDKVTAAFHAASSEVRGILESSLPQLKQEMSQQGWQFDSDGVFGGMQQFLAQQQEQQAQQQQLRSMINHARPDEYDDALAFSSNGKLQVMSATAVDYRV